MSAGSDSLRKRMRRASLALLFGAAALAGPALGADVVPNGTFDTDLSPWTEVTNGTGGTTQWDGTVFGNAAGSMRFMTDTNRNRSYQADQVTALTAPINATDTVTLSFFWYKTASSVTAAVNEIYIYAVAPSTNEVLLWSNLNAPAATQVLQGPESLNVSNLFTETGTYQLKVYADLQTANDKNANTQVNIDDIVLDVVAAANIAPTVTAGATAVSVSPVNRFGTNTTVISADFTDANQPGVGGFTASFRIREPDNATEVVLVDNQAHGAGGLTIVDNGGGSYTASYTYNPDDAQALGLYDLYFAVNDGTDTALDGYANNPDELQIEETLPNVPPSVVAGATQVTPSSINRLTAEAATLSTTFTDTDAAGIGDFTITFRVREPDNATEVVLVDAAGHGTGGLTVVDNGGGSYTASYAWDPASGQTLGLYDLYCLIDDGVDTATDGYADNLDELELTDGPPNNPPVIAAGATAVSVSPVDRSGVESTVISATFTDADAPGVGAFAVTFQVREPDNTTEVVLVDAAGDGVGGLTIVDNGGGSYTASYTWDPAAGQTVGLYDLYCLVDDGVDTATDGYADNLDELEITAGPPNNPPVITAGATAVSVSPVDRSGAESTVISATFTDADAPGVGAFAVTFRVREPDNATEVVLVDAAGDGVGGLTIVDNGGGSYTASYTWDPAAGQTVGLYDLYCLVDDGVDTATDGYADNLDELELTAGPPNIPPVITAGATAVSVSPVNRYGTEATVVSATFTDADVPGVGAFAVTFRIREPDNATEVVLVNAQSDGAGGLTITDNGGGSYTAAYTYDPSAGQTLGLYDLYCQVIDGGDTATDGYANNLDELEINEVIPNVAPVIAAGATTASPALVARLGTGTTTISTTFSDDNQPGVGAFTVTFKVREPDFVTEVVLVAAQTDGNGGLTIVDNGGGSYTASYTWDPGDTQALGYYALFCEVSDGALTATDGFPNNNNEIEILDSPPNQAPVIVAGATTATPPAIDRVGTATTSISVDFSDSDLPAVSSFLVTLKVVEPFGGQVIVLADALQDGQGGLTVTDNGGGDYTASIAWDPPDDATLGYYGLYARIDDGTDWVEDPFVDNASDLLITGGGENLAPVIPADNTFASPAGVERIGANTTTIATTFQDLDAPGTGAFTVTFKLRAPDDATEIILADNVADGAGGVAISDDGGGIYTAQIAWDPPDAQELGTYDLHFSVSDGALLATDGYANNADELEVYDAISNQPVTLVAGTTTALPSSITRLGADFTMLQATFSDPDMPGPGGFTVTFKVRDVSSQETVIANAATHGQQGVRIQALGGSDYEASILWDPPTGQVTGAYDLYFEVSDAAPATAVDGYAANADELTVTGTAVAGDGNLLRRTHDSNNCGGPNSACHNLPDHQGQSCLTCHTPHGTRNIYMVRETIGTPVSGDKTVLFKTTGQGDPHNDPDPVAGDPNAGAMADDSDGVFSGVCEVCHTATKYHRNDGTQTQFGHHNVEDCSACHSHADGFPAPEGSGESGGGVACTCHAAQFNPMSSSTTSYHHMMLSSSADYDEASRTCLMCHVDHDIFRDDLNPGIGQRARNLRVDLTTTVTAGNSAVLSNSDYQSSGTGGICLSCHTSPQSKGYTPPDGSTSTIAISKAAFDAATGSHNYNAPSTFVTDGSTFNANCSKCHNDTQAKTYQDGAGDQFGTHDSGYARVLTPLASPSPTEPLEEQHCLGCHSSANPNAGSNLDAYGVQPMSTASIQVGAAIGYAFGHPVTSVSGTHVAGEGAGNLGDGSRHAECVDCHNVHEAAQGTHDGSSTLVSNALKGVWGVEPTSWPAAPTPTDNGNVFVNVPGYQVVNPAQHEWQICLKCHSDYVTLPAGSPNLAEEINPNYPSHHGIAAPGTNDFCNTDTMNEPWGSSKVNYCSDCHRSDVSTDPNGPHGSNMDHLLVATIVSDDTVGTPLCNVCHKVAVYWNGRDGDFSRMKKHPATQGAHAVAEGCFACHMWEYSPTAGLGVNSDPAGGRIFVHGMNKKWVYYEGDGSAGSGQMSDAFLDGYLSNVDYPTMDCWANTCKTHSPQNYSR